MKAKKSKDPAENTSPKKVVKAKGQNSTNPVANKTADKSQASSVKPVESVQLVNVRPATEAEKKQDDKDQVNKKKILEGKPAETKSVNLGDGLKAQQI